MAKAFTILVLLSLFFSEVGYFFYYQFELHQVKQEIKQHLVMNMKADLLEEIDLTTNNNEIEWEEAGKEFYYRGRLYDVVATSIKNGHTILHCLDDKKEAALKKNVHSLAQQNHSSSTTQKNKHILKLTTAVYEPCQPFVLTWIPLAAELAFDRMAPCYPRLYLENPAPPPKC